MPQPSQYEPLSPANRGRVRADTNPLVQEREQRRRQPFITHLLLAIERHVIPRSHSTEHPCRLTRGQELPLGKNQESKRCQVLVIQLCERIVGRQALDRLTEAPSESVEILFLRKGEKIPQVPTEFGKERFHRPELWHFLFDILRDKAIANPAIALIRPLLIADLPECFPEITSSPRSESKEPSTTSARETGRQSTRKAWIINALIHESGISSRPHLAREPLVRCFLKYIPNGGLSKQERLLPEEMNGLAGLTG